MSGTATGRDPLMGTGTAPSINWKWQGGPVIGRHLPSKMWGNLAIKWPRSFCLSSGDGLLPIAARQSGAGSTLASRFGKISAPRGSSGSWAASGADVGLVGGC